MEEQNCEVEIKKPIFFVNSSSKVVIHLFQKALHRSLEFHDNPQKLDLIDQAGQMGSSFIRWDL